MCKKQKSGWEGCDYVTLAFIRPKSQVRVRKNEESQKVLDTLDEYMNGAVEEPMQFLGRFWEDQEVAITYAELREIIENEEVPEDIMEAWFVDYSNFISQRITPLWESALIAGSNSNTALGAIEGFVFHTSETGVRLWIANHTAELVTNCCEEQRKAILYLVGESVNYNMAPAELARYIRPTIGLTERQAAANLKHYNHVKEQLRNNHPRMAQESIERKARHSAARYAERQHRYRAETIARTEIVTAYHEGNDAAVRQAIKQDLMPRMKKVWSTARDDKVCSYCAALEGVEVEMDSGFTAKSGKRSITVVLPPAHPRCGCAVKYVEVKEAK